VDFDYVTADAQCVEEWEGAKNLRLSHEPALVTVSVLEAFEARFRNNCF